jgi:hypothetical protein
VASVSNGAGGETQESEVVVKEVKPKRHIMARGFENVSDSL